MPSAKATMVYLMKLGMIFGIGKAVDKIVDSYLKSRQNQKFPANHVWDASWKDAVDKYRDDLQQQLSPKPGFADDLVKFLADVGESVQHKEGA